MESFDIYSWILSSEIRDWMNLDDPSAFCDLQKWLFGKEGPKELMECHLLQSSMGSGLPIQPDGSCPWPMTACI